MTFQQSYHPEGVNCKREAPQNKDPFKDFNKEGHPFGSFQQDNWPFHNNDPNSYLKDFPPNFTNLNVEIKINNPISFPQNIPKVQNMNFQPLPKFQKLQNAQSLQNNNANISSLQNIPNISNIHQNSSNIQNVPGNQNMNSTSLPNIQKISNLPNIPNIPNIQNIPNLQNVQNLPNFANVQKMQLSSPSTLCLMQNPINADEKCMSEHSFASESSPVSNIRELLNCLKSPNHSSFEETCSQDTKQIKETAENLMNNNPMNVMFSEEMAPVAYKVRKLDAKTVKGEKAKGAKLQLALVNHDKKEIFLCPKNGMLCRKKRKTVLKNEANIKNKPISKVPKTKPRKPKTNDIE